MKPRTKTILLYVFTFGIAYAVAKSKAKKLANNANKELKVTYNFDFELADLVNDLGTKENIIDVNSTLNCLIVNLKDKTIVDPETLKKYNPKGMYFAGNKLNLLFGDNSKHIQECLEKFINE